MARDGFILCVRGGPNNRVISTIGLTPSSPSLSETLRAAVSQQFGQTEDALRSIQSAQAPFPELVAAVREARHRFMSEVRITTRAHTVHARCFFVPSTSL